MKLVPERDVAFQSELTRQQNHDRVRTTYANKANEVVGWIEEHMDMMKSIDASDDALETQLHNIRDLQEKLGHYQPNIEELERHNQVRVNGGIFCHCFHDSVPITRAVRVPDTS